MLTVTLLILFLFVTFVIFAGATFASETKAEVVFFTFMTIIAGYLTVYFTVDMLRVIANLM